MAAEDLLMSWNETPTRREIVDFVQSVSTEGSAGGNSNGDVPMLRFTRTGGQGALRLLVLHDDAEREFAYGRRRGRP